MKKKAASTKTTRRPRLTATQRKKIMAYTLARRSARLAASQASDLEEEVLGIVRTFGGSIHNDGADLKLGSHRTYAYSAEVTKKSSELNALRKEEREDGTADYTEKPKLVFADAMGAEV